MAVGWSEMVREVAEREYVSPALRSAVCVVIPVGELERRLKLERGFPSRHLNQICSVLESNKFANGRLELVGGKGQPRRVDTVYRFAIRHGNGIPAFDLANDPLLELSGLLRGAFAEGADAFVRELRRDK